MSRSGDDDTGLNCRRGSGGTVIQLAYTHNMTSDVTGDEWDFAERASLTLLSSDRVIRAFFSAAVW